ncbi:SDR family oxidoreductase [Streptomyces olivochromogenes]|uniref:SDR family oxidoreductase n=1 Tax=Streptomyces olivochromogenes TaxID=1963 RepID=UPI0036A35AA7
MPGRTTGTPLAGRVAVVSGASSGMGAVTAERLAELGATAVVLARRKERLDSLVKNIEAAGGTALALAVDVTDRDAVQTADQVAERFGKADLVFNNAGVQLISGIEELKVADWQRQIDLNITGLMNVIAAFLPHLTDSAAQRKAADLINTSSIAATRILAKFSIISSRLSVPAGQNTGQLSGVSNKRSASEPEDSSEVFFSRCFIPESAVWSAVSGRARRWRSRWKCGGP